LPAISPGRIGERPLLLGVGDPPEQKPRVRGCSGGFRVAGLWGNDRFLASFRPRVVSSSLALTWVATGQRADYITDGDVRETAHFSARVAICQAAGPTITDLRGQPWGTTTHGAIVAADAQTH
jgi:myo-inositol-1(or 4)-monophosphatase